VPLTRLKAMSIEKARARFTTPADQLTGCERIDLQGRVQEPITKKMTGTNCTSGAVRLGHRQRQFLGEKKLADEDPSIERGLYNTVAYTILIKSGEADTKIEANGNVVGVAPVTLKVFGDRDGTFHSFSSHEYTVHAYPRCPEQYPQSTLATSLMSACFGTPPTKMMFDGLMSRCTKPCSWRCCTAVVSARPMARHSSTGRWLRRWRSSFKV